jgi:hypothetical protein
LTRFLLTLMLGVLIAGPVWAQQSDEQVDGAEVAQDAELAADETDVEAEAIAAAEAKAKADAEAKAEAEAEEFDEAGLDDQGFADEDDDFRPSEVIPTDQSIEFPTDI